MINTLFFIIYEIIKRYFLKNNEIFIRLKKGIPFKKIHIYYRGDQYVWNNHNM